MDNIIFVNGLPVKVIGTDGSEYKSLREFCKEKHISRKTVKKQLNNTGYYSKDGVTYSTKPKGLKGKCETTDCHVSPEMSEEYQKFLAYKEIESAPFEKYEFKFKKEKHGNRYAVALFSDAHIEETVTPESVLGKNEYNIEIAKKRIENYFVNLANCINEDQIENLVFASLGDTISGMIHDELVQSNGMTPVEATLMSQNLVYSGLVYLCENTKLDKILFIGIVGNHSRTTKKIQHANGFKMSYEWLMYQNIKQQCENTKLPIEFNIPESELAILDMPDGQRFIFCHGFQIKGSGSGTVCGIYPALNRLSLKWGKTFSQNKIFLGHFHSCTSINNAMVNGSIIGFNSFALTNGMPYEEPAQMYILYDTNVGELLTRKIYCK